MPSNMSTRTIRQTYFSKDNVISKLRVHKFFNFFFIRKDSVSFEMYIWNSCLVMMLSTVGTECHIPRCFYSTNMRAILIVLHEHWFCIKIVWQSPQHSEPYNYIHTF